VSRVVDPGLRPGDGTAAFCLCMQHPAVRSTGVRGQDATRLGLGLLFRCFDGASEPFGRET
jgi:hypothetical protein